MTEPQSKSNHVSGPPLRASKGLRVVAVTDLRKTYRLQVVILLMQVINLLIGLYRIWL